MKPKFRIENESFVIENYNQAPPFSSFFPALAGETGKPMWVFYTNRGQVISSFGVNNKDGAMLEFLPANKAYQSTTSLGFRTFFQMSGRKGAWYEPFSHAKEEAEQTLIIRPYEVQIREVNKALGVEFNVHYFGVPGESSPVFARSLTISNISKKPINFKVIDGLPRVVPWGMGDFLVKHMSRTIEAFAEVGQMNKNVPFFKLKVQPDDTPDIKKLHAGFFSFSVKKGEFLPIIVDPGTVFGEDTTFHRPSPDFGASASSFDNQLKSNILPSSFFSAPGSLKPKEAKTWFSYFGFAESEVKANKFADRIIDHPHYFDAKSEENRQLFQHLVGNFGFRSANETLNAYSENTFMDNVLRGGYPLSLTPNGPIVHVYSRKHGDMERDYNSFQISATYYSQGNGNFRDVNQNRRHDILLNPKTGTTNLEFFFNLLQLDGFNPLVINPSEFIIPRDLGHSSDLKTEGEFHAEYQKLKGVPIQPGRLYEFILKYAADPLNVSNIFRHVIQRSIPQQKIQHGDGFWVDHWIYNLDHLDQFVSIYPDQLSWLLYEKKDFTFHDSDHFVKPRKEKYAVTKDGVFHQLHAVAFSQEKRNLISMRKVDPHKVRVDHGHGEVFRTTLFVKLLTLASVKASSLDPFGLGIEMEADKPGWCDALNGAPGLFGSSTHEMFELKRLVQFLLEKGAPICPTKSIEIPSEIFSFIKDLNSALSHASLKDFRPAWDKMTTARETFRDKTFMGLAGKTRPVRMADLVDFLKKISKVLESAEKQVVDPKTKLPTSYFTRSVDVSNLNSDWKSHGYKIPWVLRRVPPFLEGPVHAMKMWPASKAKKLYNQVRKSELHDKKLGMYRLNSNLKNESSDLGRICVFSRGWLENESIFLHMHYKYLLEILRAGLTQEFYKESKTGLIPFKNMEVYGRPIFENSSFVASSAFPKKEFHGKGFVARLSGATSEYLSMVYFLVIGKDSFVMTPEGVSFSPKPQLPGEWFSKVEKDFSPRNSLSLKLFGVPLTFVNPGRKNTFGPGAVKPIGFEWIFDGRYYTHEGGALPPEPSMALREGRLESLTVFLGRSSK